MKEEVRKVLSKGKAAGVLRLVFHDAGTFEMDDNSGTSLVVMMLGKDADVMIICLMLMLSYTRCGLPLKHFIHFNLNPLSC